jgi:hypothetical protein
VTDVRGNKKTGASAGCLEDRKGRSRLSKYAAEATAEHVGRAARKMGLKSVVMKVKGTTFFNKKKKVILSFREGFRGERVRGAISCGVYPRCDPASTQRMPTPQTTPGLGLGELELNL